MKKTVGLFFLEYVLLIVAGSGCIAPTPAIVPPTATSTSTFPANTPVPSATSTKAPTALPTATIEPPTVTTKFLTDAKVLRHESFDEYSWNNFDEDEIGNIRNGMFELKGLASWGGGLGYPRPLIHGNGIVVRFKLQNANGKSGFFFYGGRVDSMQGSTDFGFVVTNGHRPRANLIADLDAPHGNVRNVWGDIFSGNLRLEPDTWYNALMAIETNGEFLAVIWDPNNEDQQAVFHQIVGKRMPDTMWHFSIKDSEGETVYIDDFYAISFEEMN